MRQGPPQFDPAGWYLGPLEKRKGAPLIGRHHGQFRATANAAWPPGLCEWDAQAILGSLSNSASGGRKWRRRFANKRAKRSCFQEEEEEEQEDDIEEALKGRNPEEEGYIVDPMDPPVKGGVGPPRKCLWKGMAAPFHDGGGLCSWEEGREAPGFYLQGEAWPRMRREAVAKIHWRRKPSGWQKAEIPSS
eukprot:Skav210007  [mRNA]  locus=scaffold1212:14147:14716:- [translate_table: standard]